jgi:serine/threonine protein kinase
MDMYHWISMRSDRSNPISGEPYSAKARFTVIKSIFDQVLEGVAQVHQCGVGHRDLKPENFLIEFVDGQYLVKLTDFGLATTDAESEEFECGSKPYMSFGK